MAIVRKDKLLAGYNGNLESVIVTTDGKNSLTVVDGVLQNGVELTNGLFVHVGKLMAGERETKQASLATDSGKDVLFIHNAEVMYDERLSKLADFRIKAGKVARAYRLFNGDIVTLTTDLFAGEVAVGDILVAKADGKLAVADETDADAVVKFEVIEDAGYELDPKMGAFAVQVIR
jgi:hypothetical protein